MLGHMPPKPGPDAERHAEWSAGPIRVEQPLPGDGCAMWRLAKDSGKLDVNSSYSYVLWCRDFSETSVVAKSGPGVVGFVTGYIRPDSPDTLFVWQVAVAGSHRGMGAGSQMLRVLVSSAAARGCRYLEATVTSDNTPSLRMFEAVARSFGAPLARARGFDSDLFPDGHDPEELIRIGPLILPGDPSRKSNEEWERKSIPSTSSPS